jgi:hypothetical protein
MSKLIVNEIEKYDAGQLTITTGTNVSIGSDLTVGGSIAGTLSTAAQANVTSVGTLSSLAVSGDVSIADKIIHTGDTNTAIRFPSADTITFETSGSEKVRINPSGNVGIGTTPAAWGTTGDTKALQVSTRGAISEAFDGVTLSNNYYFAGGAGGETYIESDEAARILLGGNGVITLENAPSGTAGTQISFNERMRIDASGKVGIGTSSPDGKVTVSGTAAELNNSGTTANSLLSFKSNLGTQLNIGLNTVALDYGAYIQASDNNLAVPYVLNLQPNGGNVSIGSGNLVFPNGNGIDFSASEGGGATSSLLDDYEEGTWTPSVGGTATYSARVGKYVKIGKIVFVSCDMTISSIGTGSLYSVSGLPFSSVSDQQGQAGSIGYWSGWSQGVIYPALRIDATSTSFIIGGATSAVITAAALLNVFQDNSRIIFSATYEV